MRGRDPRKSSGQASWSQCGAPGTRARAYLEYSEVAWDESGVGSPATMTSLARPAPEAVAVEGTRPEVWLFGVPELFPELRVSSGLDFTLLPHTASWLTDVVRPRRRLRGKQPPSGERHRQKGCSRSSKSTACDEIVRTAPCVQPTAEAPKAKPKAGSRVKIRTERDSADLSQKLRVATSSEFNSWGRRRLPQAPVGQSVKGRAAEKFSDKQQLLGQ